MIAPDIIIINLYNQVVKSGRFIIILLYHHCINPGLSKPLQGRESMNTLTGIEAERVNQILRHGIDRLHILSNLPRVRDDALLQHIEQDAVLTSIQRLWKFEMEHLSLNDELLSDGCEEFEVLKRLHRSVRTVCRTVVADKSAISQMLKRPSVKIDGIGPFAKYLNDLRLIISNHMTTTVEDEAGHRNQLHELTERERHFEESRDVLQNKLDEVLDEKDKTTITLDQNLRKLQAEIQDITQVNSMHYTQMLICLCTYVYPMIFNGYYGPPLRLLRPLAMYRSLYFNMLNILIHVTNMFIITITIVRCLVQYVYI